MADHLITGTLTYVIVTCGNGRCRKTWEQAHTPLDDPGWNVCPHCNFSAPTNVRPATPHGYAHADDDTPCMEPVWCSRPHVRTPEVTR